MKRDIEGDVIQVGRFRVGDVVRSKVDLADEAQNVLPAGVILRIVAIAPKVRMLPVLDPRWQDNNPYFFNAIIADKLKGYPTIRIRANFCTVEKIKYGKPKTNKGDEGKGVQARQEHPSSAAKRKS